MGSLKRSIDGFLENNQHERGQKVESPCHQNWGTALGHRKALTPARADHVHFKKLINWEVLNSRKAAK
jgi:hypothetical protein